MCILFVFNECEKRHALTPWIPEEAYIQVSAKTLMMYVYCIHQYIQQTVQNAAFNAALNTQCL